jgi:hypothetical protein
MSEPERALSSVEESVPRFVLSVGEMQHRIQELQAFVRSQMVKDVDYGVIPGTKKPTLYKSGAEKLAAMYGFAQHVEVANKIEDWEREFFHYEVRVQLVNKRTGVVEAQGVGSANSRETRYRWRWVPERDVPQGADKSTLVRRAGKYGPLYRIDNENPADVVNTVLKMAKKRALVDAVLSATRSSGIFTQDADDFPDPEEVDAAAEPSEDARSKVREAAARAAAKDAAPAPEPRKRVAAPQEPAASAQETPQEPAQEPPPDPHTAVRVQLGRLGLRGADVRRLLAPFEALDVISLRPEQAAALANALATVEAGEGATERAVEAVRALEEAGT